MNSIKKLFLNEKPNHNDQTPCIVFGHGIFPQVWLDIRTQIPIIKFHSFKGDLMIITNNYPFILKDGVERIISVFSFDFFQKFKSQELNFGEFLSLSVLPGTEPSAPPMMSSSTNPYSIETQLEDVKTHLMVLSKKISKKVDDFEIESLRSLFQDLTQRVIALETKIQLIKTNTLPQKSKTQWIPGQIVELLFPDEQPPDCMQACDGQLIKDGPLKGSATPIRENCWIVII